MVRFNPGKQRSGRTLMVAVAAGLLVASNSAHAGMPVMDIPGLINAIQNFIATAEQYEKEVNQWKDMKDDARIGKSLQFSLSLPAGLTLDPIDENYMVAETCGEEARHLPLLSNLLDSAGSHRTNKEKQRQLCVNMQIVKNQKFNDTVGFLNSTIREAEHVAKTISAKRTTSDSSGNVQSSSSDAERFNSEFAIKVQQWEVRMKSYDAYLEVVQGYQNQLAKAALKGDQKTTIVADLLRNGALREALDLD